MSQSELRKTLDDIFKYNGYEGVVRYFADQKGMLREEAEGAANAWGYNEEISPSQLSLFGDKPVELIDHEISQEDLDMNPELVTEGVKVGEVIQLPVVSLSEEEMIAVKKDIEKKQPNLFQKIFGF